MTGGVAVAVTILGAFDGVHGAAVVRAGRDFEVLILGEVRKMLGHRVDVCLDQIGTEGEQRAGV